MMRRKWTAGLAVGLAGAAMLVGAGSAHAQARGGSSMGGSSLGGGGLGGSSLGGGGLGGSSLGGGGLGGSSLGGGLGGGSSGLGGGGLSGSGGTTYGSSRGGSGSTGYGSTGPMGPYMGNPMSLGVPSTTGTATFGATGTTRTRTFGTALFSVNTGTTTGTGGTANLMSGRTMGASSYGARRAPAYITVLGETVPPIRPDMLRVRADLQGIIDRAGRLPSRGNIRVLTDGSTVVLRGSVSNDHERRLAEALVRLTPGVRSVRNELVTPE